MPNEGRVPGRPWRKIDGTPAREGPVPEPFTPGFFAEVNQGPLEKAYDERQRDPATWNPIPWAFVAVGVVIGLLFAYVNIYGALALGITVGGSWYITYFIGMVARWRPGVINYVGGASTGASQVVIGVAFALPALFFLSTRADPAWGFPALYSFDEVPSLWALTGFFLVGGVFGVLFFQFYRRIWVVERPLQYPGGFESTMQLLTVAQADRVEDRAAARLSVWVVALAAVASGFFVLLRDLAFVNTRDGRRSVFDAVAAGDYYRSGYLPDTWVFRPFYNGFFFLDPFFLAIGWFVRTRVALVILLGSLVTFILPFFDGAANDDAFLLFLAWNGTARNLAAGAIVGAGAVALIRLRGVIGSGLRAMFSPDSPGAGRFLSRRLVIGVIVVGMLLAFAFLVAGGVPLGGAALVVPLGALLVAVLGLVAVKVTGETSVQAVSPMTIVALLALLLLLQLVGFSGVSLMVLALGAAAFFATGLIMSTDMFLDSKVALYVGNPPHRQALVQLAGLVPGVILGTFAVWTFADEIASDAANATLTAPFGRIFAGLAVAFTGGEFDWLLFVIAVALGAMVEIATGLGTAFGVGMALQLFAPVTLMAGALLRGLYERMFGARRSDADNMVWRVALPAGLFVGASIAAAAVFALDRFVLN